METFKKASLYICGATALAYLAVTLYYIFSGPFDLRPYGVGVYMAGVEKPLAFFGVFLFLFLFLLPAGAMGRWASRDRLGFIPSPARSAMALLLAIASLAHALAWAMYMIFGKIAITTALGRIAVNNGLKPGAIALLAAFAAFLALSGPSRRGVMASVWGWRFHMSLAALTLALCFAMGELAVRVAAGSMPGVRYMVFVGEEERGEIYPDLKTYLASKPDIKPFMPLLNYYDNSLGMRDVEFESPKPKGRYRIMALGDSFTYGMAPYPDTVMTQMEKELQAACGGMDLDVLNFGITGGELQDYQTIYELAESRYQPDLVALHFYMGNDGPNLRHDAIPENAARRPSFKGSYLVRYLKNMLTVAQSVESARLLNEWTRFGQEKQGEKACGGCPVTPGLEITDDSPELKNPYFVPVRWNFYIAVIEIESMYVEDKAEAERRWAPTLETLGRIADQVEGAGRKFALVMYPSSFQVYPSRIDEFMEAIGQVDKYIDDLPSPEEAERFRSIRRENIKTDHPNLMLARFCLERGVACLDATAPLLAAASASEKPLYRSRETHWLIHGNKVAARAEARFLKELVCP